MGGTPREKEIDLQYTAPQIIVESKGSSIVDFDNSLVSSAGTKVSQAFNTGALRKGLNLSSELELETSTQTNVSKQSGGADTNQSGGSIKQAIAVEVGGGVPLVAEAKTTVTNEVETNFQQIKEINWSNTQEEGKGQAARYRWSFNVDTSNLSEKNPIKYKAPNWASTSGDLPSPSSYDDYTLKLGKSYQIILSATKSNIDIPISSPGAYYEEQKPGSLKTKYISGDATIKGGADYIVGSLFGNIAGTASDGNYKAASGVSIPDAGITNVGSNINVKFSASSRTVAGYSAELLIKEVVDVPAKSASSLSLDSASGQTVSAPILPSKIDLALVLNDPAAPIGAYLDLTTVKGLTAEVTGSGSKEGDIVLAGDNNVIFKNFSNSILNSGSGDNAYYLTSQNVGNTIYLNEGSDTVFIDGDGNFLKAGPGSDLIVLGGKGTTGIQTDVGGDILRITSPDAKFVVSDWNYQEDYIQIGGGISLSDAKMNFDASKGAFILTIGGKTVGTLFAALDSLPSYDDATKSYAGTKLIPIDTNDKSNDSFVTQVYSSAFGRAPENKSLTYWSSMLNDKLSRTDFIKSVFTSTEFTKNHVSNADFIKELYNDLMGRIGDAAGQKFWSSALDTGLSRAVVVDAFTHSVEFVELVGLPAPAAPAAIVDA